MCAGAVDTSAGGGKETGGAGWGPGEWQVGRILHLISCWSCLVFWCSLVQPAALFLLIRLACRDIGGSDPERMAAPRVAEYVQELFKDSPVQVARNVEWETESQDPLFLFLVI